MRLIRIDHVSLNVGDRPASIAWYEQVLGLRVGAHHDVPDEPVFLGPDGAQLGLFADRAAGLRHVAFATDAPGQQELMVRLDRPGVDHRPERHRDSDSVYFRDPDGITLEILVPRA